MAGYASKRQKFEILRGQLDGERSTFLSHWRDLGDYILPRRPRFTITDNNRGERKNQKIIDSTATLASRTLRSGMMSGITSPARPWFRLSTEEPGAAEDGEVKAWLSIVGDRMSNVFLRSNIYNALPIIYGDLGVFGTAAMLIDEDFTGDVIRAYPFSVGSYYIGNDELGRVRVFLRDFRMTVRQVVDKFGKKNQNGEIVWDNFSSFVANEYRDGRYETWVEVCQVIAPNDEHDPKRLESKYKKYISCYYERGTTGGSGMSTMTALDDHKILYESGYNYFPVLAPRWEVADGDVYGTDCPGMTALGDIRQLQLGERRAAQAIEKKVNPPMVGPTSLRSVKASIIAGDITFVDERDGQKGFRTAHEVNLSINELEMKQDQVRQRIRRSFYEDLFLMLSNTNRRQITAREIDERHEEKLLALGPVLEQLNQDLLDPLIDITFQVMLNQGMIPEPPEALQGKDLKVEYISVMAQAQKLVGISGMERFAGMVGQIVQTTQSPESLDKVDADQFIDVYGDLSGVPPGIIRSDEQVEAMRVARAKAQQAQSVGQNIQTAAGVAKDLSKANLSENNALGALLAQANAGNLIPQ